MQSVLTIDTAEAFKTTAMASSPLPNSAETSLLIFPLNDERRSSPPAQIGPRPTIVNDGEAVLDGAYSLMFEGRTADGVQALIEGLADLRARFASTPDDWHYFAHGVCRAHPIADLIRQDPMAMASSKDQRTALLDYVYDNHEPDGVSMTGRQVAAQTRNIALARSLRSRRSILARRIDEAGMQANVRILVIGAGRFHEGALSKIVKSGRFEELVVVDEDADALKSVEAEFAGRDARATFRQSGVKTVQASVRALLSRSVEFSGFDLVYAPTLLDSLPDAEARRLAETMFSMLRPGGRALLVNAGDSLADAAYREAFLGWSINGRGEAELVALTSAIPSRLIGQVRLYRDEYGISNFVELFRR